MSTVTIRETFKADGVYVDPTSVKLSNAAATAGVIRNDTSAVVVADDTAMTKEAVGIYSYTFTEPASDLTYTYWVEWVYGGETFRDEKTVAGATSGGGICTTADVETRIGETSETFDALIAQIINGVAAAFESYCHRPLVQAAAAVTEYYTGECEYLRLKRYPIIAITSIVESADFDWDNEDALTVDDDYRVMAGGAKGILYRVGGWWLNYPDGIRAIYNGGYKAAGEVAGAGETAMPADLREAAIQQAAWWFKRRDDIGITAMGFQGGDVQKVVAGLELLPGVREILENYRRISL